MFLRPIDLKGSFETGPKTLGPILKKLLDFLDPKVRFLAPRGLGKLFKNKPVSGSHRSYPEEKFGALLGSLAPLLKVL